MGGDSSASASDPQGADGLPLIWCTECGMRQVVRRVSQQPWSVGQVFYCCPKYKRDGSGCPFWYWEEDYVDVVAGKIPSHGKGSRARSGKGNRDNVSRGIVQGESSMMGVVGMMNKEAELVGIGKELVSLVKVICVTAICMLFVLILIVVVLLVK
ncbi:unnamed protein product [Urochloa humidicola]